MGMFCCVEKVRKMLEKGRSCSEKCYSKKVEDVEKC